MITFALLPIVIVHFASLTVLAADMLSANLD
jgi:hypothetical protein